MEKIISLILSAIICISLLPITVNAETYTPTTIDYYNGHTYAVYDVYLTWNEAKKYCEDIGGHLATITNEEEYINIMNLMNASNSSDCWLGASDAETEGIWKWVTGEKWGYTNWAKGEPSNKNGYTGAAENYLCMYSNTNNYNPIYHYRWNDCIIDERTNGCFICEWETIIGMNAITNTTSEIKSYISDLYVSENYGMNSYNIMTEYTAIAAGNDTEMLITPTVVRNGENLSDLKVYLTQGADKILEIDNFGGTTITPGTFFEPNKNIYVLLKNTATGQSSTKLTKLKIVTERLESENLWYLEGDIEDEPVTFKIGNKIGFVIPDSIPVFGDTEVCFDIDVIPLCFEYAHNDKINIVFGTNIATQKGEKDRLWGDVKYFKDFDFKQYKKDFKDAISKNDRTLKQLRNDYKMKNKIKLSSFKNISGNIDAAGYAEAQYINGKWVFTEGMLGVEASLQYTYRGNTFVYIAPVTYSIGGEIGAGIEGTIINLSPDNFVPQLDGYLTGKLGATIGGGIGNSHLAAATVNGTGNLNIKKSLTTDYLKSWVDASAYLALVTLDKEIAKKTFANASILIYETGNPNGLIKDNNVSLMSVNDVYSSYDKSQVYKAAPRAVEEAEWVGGCPSVNLFSAEYSNKDVKILSNNEYFNAEPIIDIIDGKKVMVWLTDNLQRDTYNKTMLVYSVYDDENGTWSAPIAIHDDGTPDFYPDFNDGYVVWQNKKTLTTENNTLVDIAADTEIYIAKFNGLSFDEPQQITSNDVMDAKPKVSASGEDVDIVWVTNDENDILGTSGKNAINYCRLSSDTTVIENNLNVITDLSLGYVNDKLTIAYSYDNDNDLSTIDDRDIYIFSESIITNLTNDDIVNSNPIFENGTLYWYTNNNIYYTDNLSDINTVFESSSIETDMFNVHSNSNGDAAIWWSGTVEGGTEVYASLRKENTWSECIKLTSLGGNIKSPNGVLDDNGKMVVAFNQYVFNENEMNADLCTVTVTPSYDISLKSADYNETELSSGEDFPITLEVVNCGEKQIDEFKVSISDDNSVCNEYVFSETIKAGETKTVTVNYSVPVDMTKKDIIISTEISNDDEYNTSNNSLTISLGKADIVIDSIKVHEIEDKIQISAIVSNKGFESANNITMNLKEDKETGNIMQTDSISKLDSGESTEVSFVCDAYDLVYTDGLKQLYVTAEYSDNIYSDYIIVEERKSTADFEQLIPLVSYDDINNIVNINAIVKNNTQDDTNFTMVFCIYNDNQLVGVYIKEGSVKRYNETAVDGFINLDNYNSNYTVSTILLDDLSNISPLCDKATY